MARAKAVGMVPMQGSGPCVTGLGLGVGRVHSRTTAMKGVKTGAQRDQTMISRAQARRAKEMAQANQPEMNEQVQIQGHGQ